MESNQEALATVDRAFLDLERRIAELDQLSDRLQLSRERIADLDGEISQVKNDIDGLERSKRVSRLTALNSSKEIAQSDDSRLVAAVVTAKGRILASGAGSAKSDFGNLLAAYASEEIERNASSGNALRNSQDSDST